MLSGAREGKKKIRLRAFAAHPSIHNLAPTPPSPNPPTHPPTHLPLLPVSRTREPYGEVWIELHASVGAGCATMGKRKACNKKEQSSKSSIA